MPQDIQIEQLARQRIRSLRRARGWSLDELGRRAHMGPSTLSRIETGQRRLTLDHIAVLARALDTTVDDLLVDDTSEDVVIRPTKDTAGGSTYWMLTRPGDGSGRVVAKIKLPQRKKLPDQQVHPGRDWFYVLAGTVRLVLGGREHLIETGQAAEFDTMTPHSLSGYGGPAEIISILDQHGERTHLREH